MAMNAYCRRHAAAISRTAGAARNGLLFPVSGGSDSAYGFRICVEALGINKVLGVYIGKQLRGADWFESFAPGRILYLPEDPSWQDKEIMRWAAFLSIAKERSLWLTGALTLTEELMGTFSMASRVATYLPLNGLYKSEVMVLAQAMRVPGEILASSRRADPDCGRPTEMAEIPLEYIDLFLRLGRRSAALRKLLSAEQIAYLAQVQDRNAFKRALPTRGKRIAVLKPVHMLSRARQFMRTA